MERYSGVMGCTSETGVMQDKEMQSELMCCSWRRFGKLMGSKVIKILEECIQDMMLCSCVVLFCGCVVV